MTLTVVEIWVLLVESIGMLIVDRKILALYVPLVLLTIVLFFFFPR
ncbi:MAG TPA: hypothetical protein VJI32_01545 [Candidatus Nanoarchaeia archaeon]|nr:hypothetical protein [Candidatus Nanoarchaeia archaeon]